MEEKERITKMDAIRSEMREIGKDMGGINPKLSIHAEMQKQLDVLNDALQALKAERE